MFGISYGVQGDDFEIRFVALSDDFLCLELNVAETLSGMVGVVFGIFVELAYLWEYRAYLEDFEYQPELV